MQNEGYDGVINEEDGAIWEYVAFNPNQIKSADPVTYDDAGNVIPLSERFNTRKEDIRYAITRSTEEFDTVRDLAVSNNGSVMPNLASKSVPIIQYNGEEKTPYNLSRSAIKEGALKNVVDEDSFIIDSNGEKHYCPITATSLNKYIDDSANDKSVSRKVHLLTLPLLSKILANSIEVEVHPDYIKKNGERMPENGVNSQVLIHRFYGAVEIEGVVYRTKTTVKEYRDKNTHLKPYTYEVTKIELLAPATDNVKDNTTNHPRTPSNSINATKLLQKVEKSYDKGVKVLEESISSEENSTQTLTTANGDMVADVNEAQGQALFSLRTYREGGS